MLDYLNPASKLTLREAITLLREEDAKDRDMASVVAPEVAQSMTAHDAVHVIFGCDTSDKGEAVAHAWMLLGTTVTHRQLREVMGSRDHRSFARELGHTRRIGALVSALPAIVRSAARAIRMQRRWAWDEYHRHLDTSLVDIRRDLGVRILSRDTAI